MSDNAARVWRRRWAIGIAAIVLLIAPFRHSMRATPANSDVMALLDQMTQEEKLSLVHGAPDPEDLGEAGYWPGVPRLGIPPLRFVDGPPGISVNKASTAMPAPIALAATFSAEAARLYGSVLGREARALRQDVLLAPHINLDRDPIFARNQTTFGEDPLLTGVMADGFTRGVQDQGVMAQVKHLAGYNGSGNVEIDERTLHEIYLPAFEAAIHAGASSLMCAYNKLNGPYACENPEVQNEIVRRQFGFQGFITSDWGATHSTGAIAKGLDLEMPGPREGVKTHFTDSLSNAVMAGDISESVLNQAVSHILLQMDRFHLIGRKTVPSSAIDVEGDARIVRDIAVQSAVLLKNENGILPLKDKDLSSLILIGPTGGQLAVGSGGERGYGFEKRFKSPLEAIRSLASTRNKVNISYEIGDDLTGVPLARPVLSSGNSMGLLRHQTSPSSSESRLDEVMDFKGATALAPGTAYAWTGTLTIPVDGDYTFMLQAAVGDGANGNGGVTIDGRKVFTARGGVVPPGFGGLDAGPNGAIVKKWASLLPTTDGRNNPRATLHLSAGPHPIEITAMSSGQKALEIRFNWMTPELLRAKIEKAVTSAKSYRTAIVFAWSAGGDQKMMLPDMQDELIRRVAEANPRTIVVLNSGFPVTMPWKERVHAILSMWYPGQEGGDATADVLFGRENPGGKLPFTIPAKLEDSAPYAPGHAERVPQSGTGGANAGEVPVVKFSEGILMGYRWFDHDNINPQFPFGYGLSYTRFRYSGLKVDKPRDGVDVTFALTNIGSVRGAEVAQVYLGPPKDPIVPVAPKSLAGFERIELNPGQFKRVTVHIDERAFCYWSSSDHSWVGLSGERPIYVGSSSRDIRLQGTSIVSTPNASCRLRP